VTSVLACFDLALARLHQHPLAQQHTATASSSPTNIFIMDRTPSPPRRLHTPPAPLHAFTHGYEPYSPRRSTRVAAQREVHLHHEQTSPRARRDVTPTASSKRKATSRISNFTLSPPSSPISSPQLRSPRSMRRAHIEAGPLDSDPELPAPTPARRLLSTMPPVRSLTPMDLHQHAFAKQQPPCVL
jgi:hypothetical protein